jgi:Tudor domain
LFGIFVAVTLNDESLIDICLNDRILSECLKRIPLDSQINRMAVKYNEQRYLTYDPVLMPESPPKNRTRRKSVPSIYDYKTNVEVGARYSARIVAYENGPNHFYARIDEENEACFRLCDDIRKVPLDLAEQPLIEGRKYLALEGDKISRIKVVKANSEENSLVHYEDEGHKKILSNYKLYNMPQNFKIIPPFARSFMLTDISELAKRNRGEINFYFQHLTNKRKITLRPDSELTGKKILILIKTLIIFKNFTFLF